MIGLFIYKNQSSSNLSEESESSHLPLESLPKNFIGDSQSNQSFGGIRRRGAHLSELAMDRRVKTEQYFKTLNQYWGQTTNHH
jgi:hypothetical protein